MRDRVKQETSGTKVEVVRVDDRHAATLAEFIREVWDSRATPEGVRRARVAAAAANPVTPGEEIPTFLFLANGRALGHVTTIPIRLWSGGTERPAHWVKGLWVLPEHRNGPVGFLLLKEAVRHLGFAMAMVVEPAPRRLFEALGFTDVGAVPNFLRVLRPAKVLRELDVASIDLARMPRCLSLAVRTTQWSGIATGAVAVAAGVTWLWTAAAGGPGHRFKVEAPTGVNVREYDDLWRLTRTEIAAGPVRDASYIRRRYSSRDEGRYQLVTVRRDSALVGFAVVRQPRTEGDPRLKGIRVATLSEATFPTDRTDVGLALVAAAEETARQLEVDALLCTASHRSLPPLLRRRGFVRLPGNVHFLVHRPAGECNLPGVLADWWLMRGDSEADEVF